MKLLNLTCFALIISLSAQAQVFKNLDKRLKKQVERQIERKIERKTQEKTDDVLDRVFDGKKKQRDKGVNNDTKTGQEKNTKEKNDTPSPKNNRTTRSAKDFVSGKTVVFEESFSRDQIGDFPGTWNTNSSGEVVQFNNDNTKWLKMLSKGTFTPDGIQSIPENSTLEFDLSVDDENSFYSHGFVINVVELNNRTNDFTNWKRFKNGKNGVSIRLVPNAASNRSNLGRSEIINYLSDKSVLKNKKEISSFSRKSSTVHVALWRQKERLRVYVNDQKIWDVPRAFGKANYNGLVFLVDTKGESYYVSNIRLAMAGADTRHKLLEAGRFSTNEILFESGSTKLKQASYKHIDEIGQLMQSNPSLKVKIIGHTDSDGEAGGNFVLSEGRALSVKKYLNNNYPIAGNRLLTEGRGESQPIADNESSEGKSQNRRVEFLVIK